MPAPISHLNVRAVRAFADNYIWLIEAPRAPGRMVVVDPGDAAPVLAELRQRGESLAAILLTHHHPDHIGGVATLLAQAPRAGAAAAVGATPAPLPVIGPDDARIPQRTQTARDGDRIELPELGLGFETLAVPGHTVSHVAYLSPGVLFCGDTLFSAGCGRMFEGTAPQMSASLERLRALPPETRVYCAHEYTTSNLKFALAVEPDNADTRAYAKDVAALRAADEPTVPSSIERERRINPFLRIGEPHVRAAAERHAGRALSAPAEVFAVLRAWKDDFRA